MKITSFLKYDKSAGVEILLESVSVDSVDQENIGAS